MEIKLLLGALILFPGICIAYVLNVCTIVADGGIMPYGIFRSGPALQMGLDALKAIVPANVTVNYYVNTTTMWCTPEKAGALAAEMYYQRGVTVFIGPGKY